MHYQRCYVNVMCLHSLLILEIILLNEMIYIKYYSFPIILEKYIHFKAQRVKNYAPRSRKKITILNSETRCCKFKLNRQARKCSNEYSMQSFLECIYSSLWNLHSTVKFHTFEIVVKCKMLQECSFFILCGSSGIRKNPI